MNIQPKFDGVRWTARAELADGVVTTIEIAATQFTTIGVTPPAGGSVLVESTASSREHLEAGTAEFYFAEGLGAGGVVAAKVLDVFPGPITAIRVTATGAGGIVETLQASDQ